MVARANLTGFKYSFLPGPPFPSSERIHAGSAANQVLKDVWHRYLGLLGYERPPFVFDAQGLPIEQALERIRGHRGGGKEWIEDCLELVKKNSGGMLSEFKKLGIGIDNVIYTTDLKPKLRLMETFIKLWREGYIRESVRRVSYCKTCKSSLAQAEIEFRKSPVTRFHTLALPTDHIHDGKVCKILMVTTNPETLVNVKGFAAAKTTFNIYKKDDDYYISANPFDSTYVKVDVIDNLTSIKVYYDTKMLPLFTSDRVTVSNNESPLLRVGIVIISPTHSEKDYEIYASYDEKGAIAASQQWAYNKGRYLQEVEAKTYLRYQVSSTVDERIVDVCWRCSTRTVTLLQDEWFLDTSSLIPKLKEHLHDLIDRGAMVGEREMGQVTKKWWLKGYKWSLSREREFLTPLPLGYCDNKMCDEMGRYHPLNFEIKDFEADSECYYSTITRVIARTPRNHCNLCRRPLVNIKRGLNVWLDSGNLPFLLEGKAQLAVEGRDQVQGWFYSLAVLGIALGGNLPFSKLAYTGWVLDGRGEKFSKSKLTKSEPFVEQLLERNTVDSLRAYLLGCASTKDFVFNPEDICKQTKYIRTFLNCEAYAKTLPLNKKSTSQLLTMVGETELSGYNRLKVLVKNYLRSGHIRNYWLNVKAFLLHTLSRGLINSSKEQLRTDPLATTGIDIVVCTRLLRILCTPVYLWDTPLDSDSLVLLRDWMGYRE